MSSVAGPSRPKYCSECGGKIADSDRFCGGCGGAVGAPAAPKAAARGKPTQAFLAALLLGGIWVVANRVRAQGAVAWLSIVGSVAWLLLALPVALWWVGFAFLRRESLEDETILHATTAWACLLFFSPLLNLALARRASALLEDPRPERQRAQARKGTFLYATVAAVLAATWAADRSVATAIALRREKAAQERLWEELDREFPNGGADSRRGADSGPPVGSAR